MHQIEKLLEYQPSNIHLEITNTSNYAKVKKLLTKRYQTKIWMTLTDDISKIYLDNEQNLQFNDNYLEEIMDKTSAVEFTLSGLNQTLEIL